MGTKKGGKKRADRFLLLLTKQRERGNYKETEPGKMHNNVLIWAQGQGEVSKKGLMKENGKMRSVCAAGALVVEIPVLDYLLLHKDSPYPIPPQRQQ